MALNGTQTTRLLDRFGNEAADLIFTWEVINQSQIDNTSTIKWDVDIYVEGNSRVDTYIRRVYIDGKRVFSESFQHNFAGYNTNHNNVAEGIEIIEHDLDGSYKDFKYKVEIFVRYDDGDIYNTQIATLEENDIEIDSLERMAVIVSASNFNDTDNPEITFQVGGSDLTKLEVGLSLDGENTDVFNYTSISTTSKSYTYMLTEEQREKLRKKVQGSDTAPIYYLLRTTYTRGTETLTTVAQTSRIVTIVGCYPVVSVADVKDIKPETIALTGDENIIVENESMIEYSFSAAASKHATIVSQVVQCGSKIVKDMPQGVIDDAESGTITYNVVDSRGMAAATSVFKEAIAYVKPTCHQKIDIELSGETSAKIKLTVSGNYFNGSFGLKNNTLQLQVRYTNNSGQMGEWQQLSGTPTYSNKTYNLSAEFTGFDYGKSYVFQCRATDELNFVESSQYTVRVLPVFDWSESDFNFNVPVNINADELSLNEETIIRHSADTNNTVLSASGGNIYLRPGGTNNTSGETIFYGNGSIKFGGAVDLGDSFTLNGNKIADYIIETGEEAMGSNGTWYWAKWASGKAECWGCRNFGVTAVTTNWGGLFRSDIFTQILPDDVFKTTPDVINISVVNSNFGGWICKHENAAPSAVTTGSFIFVRPASATVTPLYIGFHVIGVW